MKVLARTRARPARVATIRSVDPAVADLGCLDERVEEGPGAGFRDEALPDDLEVLGEVGHAGARRRTCSAAPGPGRVRAGPPRRRRRSRRRPCGPPTPACRSRRTCRGPRCSSRRGTAGGRSAGPRRRRGLRRSRRSSPPSRTRRRRRRPRRSSGRAREGHGAGSASRSGSGETEVTDQPPSTFSELPGDGPGLVRQEVDGGLGDLVGVEHLAGERLLPAGVREDRAGRSRRAAPSGSASGTARRC